MNKFFKKAAILAFGLGVAMSFTACHSGEGESLPTWSTSSAAGLTYDLVVELNMAPASIKYDGKNGVKQAGSGFVYVFSNVDKDKQLVVTAPAGYKSDFTAAANKVVSFGDETAKYIYLTLYPDMTDSSNPEYDATVVKSQDATSKINTTNSSANQSNNDNTVVSLEVPAGSGDVEGTDDPFSIYLYTPGNEGGEELEKQDDAAEVSVLAIACTPDGASWTDKPEDQRPLVTAVLEKASELDVKLVNSTNKAEALTLTYNPANPDEVSARIPHFSSWYYMLNARVVSVKSEEVPVYDNPQRYVTSGNKYQIKYDRKLGVAASGNNLPLLVKKYIQVLFGNSSATIKSTYNYTPQMTGIATESIKQVKKTLTVKSKNYSFDVTVWGAIKPQVTVYAKTHSGGANE
jgi:hypothetical protein